MSLLSHVDEKGSAVMVDVTEKDVTYRMARAGGLIHMNGSALKAVSEGSAAKGDVLATARIAGIMAVKKTSDLIPLCHPLQLTKVSIDLEVCPDRGYIRCECEVRLMGKTGAEMEALTGVSVALLTIYDMCKALDKAMVISDISLKEKDGGRSGHFIPDPVPEHKDHIEIIKEEKQIKTEKGDLNENKEEPDKKGIQIGW